MKKGTIVAIKKGTEVIFSGTSCDFPLILQCDLIVAFSRNNRKSTGYKLISELSIDVSYMVDMSIHSETPYWNFNKGCSLRVPKN